MILLSVRDVARQFDVDPVFRDVSFDVRTGERIALVGPNGTGKTTLLNILCGIDHADTGEVERGPQTVIGYLEQETVFPPGRTLREEAEAGLKHLLDLQREAQELAEQMASADARKLESLQRRFDHLQFELERQDAYTVDHRIDEVLFGLGFGSDDYDRPLVQFSGGQRNRALLARLLLQAPDLMLLDEPTNHLDIAATEWLESYLIRSAQSVILVSHDRYFLDRVTTRTMELFSGRLNDYKGNFTSYWQQREERIKLLERTAEKQQEFIEKTEDFIRRNKYGQKHAQAADRQKKLERVERVELVQDFQQLKMNFGEPTRTGDWVIDAVDISKGFGSPLFEHLTLRVHRGDRLGIIGPNGSGKTTLLQTLLGQLEPDGGSIRLGTGVRIAYFDQQLESIDPELTAIDAARPDDRLEMTPAVIRGLLARFGIRGELALQKVGNMSGGEKSKVALARLAALNANVLVLDEPTNHLDLWARDSLEESLRAFPGTLLFVSHDRYFLDQVATSVLVLDPSGWTFHEGNYTEYLAFRESIARQQSAVVVAERKDTPDSAATTGSHESKSPRRKRRFAYRQVEDLEAEIAEQEELLESLRDQLGDPETLRDGELVKTVMQQYESTEQRLATLYEHWEEASEMN